MRLTELLTPHRVDIQSNASGQFDKAQALKRLADLLGGRGDAKAEDIERVLREREDLQSTGIGDGVAIPHGAMSEITTQVAALLIVPEGVDFQAIDEGKVNILFGVVGPKRATGEHLKVLARVSRLLRDAQFRSRLVQAPSAAQAFSLIDTEETAKVGGA